MINGFVGFNKFLNLINFIIYICCLHAYFVLYIIVRSKISGNEIKYVKRTDEELYKYFDSIGVPRNTDGDFSKSPIQATSEGMVTFGTTVTQGYLDVPVNDFSSLTGRLPLSIEYVFEHVEDYLLGDRHPSE